MKISGLLVMLLSSLIVHADPTDSRAKFDLVKSANTFGLQEFGFAMKQNAERNVVFSPLSAHLMLSLLMNGAGGVTAEQMARTIGIPLSALEAANQQNAQLIRDMNSRPSGELKLMVANGLWVRPTAPLKPDFETLAKDRFQAEVAPLQSAEQVNGWATTRTNGLVSHILDDVSDLQLLMANATYFKGDWTVHFSAAHPGDFFSLSMGGPIRADMMDVSLVTRHLGRDDYEAVELGYGPNRLTSMIAVLPAKGTDFTAFRTRIDGNWWQELTTQLDSSEPVFVAVTLPKTKAQTGFMMNDSLKAMGMPDAFSSNADFSKLSNSPLTVSFVKQDCAIRIDENGTEAAAVTSAGLRMLAVRRPALSFVANRPFLYFIRDTSSGAILFAGQVMNP